MVHLVGYNAVEGDDAGMAHSGEGLGLLDHLGHALGGGNAVQLLDGNLHSQPPRQVDRPELASPQLLHLHVANP